MSMTVGFNFKKKISFLQNAMFQGRGGSALNEEEKRMIESEDFDFEANLAMFDKEREMQVM